jgi:hypothetical protein
MVFLFFLFSLGILFSLDIFFLLSLGLELV